jgi:hypothetical protein
MSDVENPPSDSSDRPDDEQTHDQDSEPTMNAPEEGRPDGLDALDDDTDSTGGDGSPS